MIPRIREECNRGSRSPIDLRTIASYINVKSKDRCHPTKVLNAGEHNHADRRTRVGVCVDIGSGIRHRCWTTLTTAHCFHNLSDIDTVPFPLIKPPPIHAGDVIGLVSPASPVADLSRVESGTRYLERNGFRVKVGTHVGKSFGYLAGTDRDRADDLHEMIRDPSVKAVFCLRGGYGVTRTLPLLDFELIRRNPKIIVGYSDVTALLLAVCARSSLVTFHGPMVAVEFSGTVDQRTEESFWALMLGKHDPGAFVIADPATTHVLYGGQATGMLLGGNLSLLAAMAGTPYLPDFSKRSGRNPIASIEWSRNFSRRAFYAMSVLY